MELEFFDLLELSPNQTLLTGHLTKQRQSYLFFKQVFNGNKESDFIAFIVLYIFHLQLLIVKVKDVFSWLFEIQELYEYKLKCKNNGN